jgi:hypothetical protein
MTTPKDRDIRAQAAIRSAAILFQQGAGNAADVLEAATAFYEWVRQRSGEELPFPTEVVNVLPDPTSCPVCHGEIWSNVEANKERIKAGKKPMPEFKCKDTKCGWLQWPQDQQSQKSA